MRKFPETLRKEFKVFKNLKTPWKIQDFLDDLPINFEEKEDTCYSPLKSLKLKKAHCMEGAMLAAAALWYHGREPLLLDLKTTDDDESHVVTIFKISGLWGAMSKTNHPVLRYRDPIFRNIRELVMSYFNEYFLDKGKKTLRQYTTLNLRKYGHEWLIDEEDLWHIVEDLDSKPHTKILRNGSHKRLRFITNIEARGGDFEEWKRGKGNPYKKTYKITPQKIRNVRGQS